LGISTHTIHRWKQEDVAPADLEAAKKAILASDYENVSKATYFKGQMLDELIRRTETGELEEVPLQILSRAGVDTAKIYGITTDKILLKEGGITQAPSTITHEKMLAMLLAKGQTDRDRAELIKEERKAYEAMYANEAKGSKTIDV